jgi:hypothetical protein
MPFSDIETKPWGMSKILELDPRPECILDVGPGAGLWVAWLRTNHYEGIVDGIEIWEPYAERFNLYDQYDQLFIADARTWTDFDYDVVILGDVIEHMTKDEAVALIDKVASQAHYALIALPIVHYIQGPEFGNPYEEHVKDDWSHKEMLETFPQIVDSIQCETTGAYWLDFERKS